MSENQNQVTKIIALDKEVILPGPVSISSVEKDNVLSFIKDFNASLGSQLESIPFRSEVKNGSLLIYRTDAHFG